MASLPPLGLLTARVTAVRKSLLTNRIFQSSSPALKLIFPLLISIVLLGAPDVLTATALMISGAILWFVITSPRFICMVSPITRACILKSGRSCENFPPANPLGYFPSSIIQTFMSRFLASTTPVRIALNHSSERYLKGSL